MTLARYPKLEGLRFVFIQNLQIAGISSPSTILPTVIAVHLWELKHGPQCADWDGMEVGAEGNALRACVQHDAANEFLPCLFGEETKPLKVVGSWTGRFFNFDSDEMTA